MKKLQIHIPRRLRLGIDLAAVVLLLFLIWAFFDYPCLTANQAFRRALKNAAYPDAKLELLLETSSYYSKHNGYGANDSFAYCVSLSDKKGWKPYRVESCKTEAAKDIWCLQIPWSMDLTLSSWDGSSNSYCIYEFSGFSSSKETVPCFAVKAPGETAALTLVLEEGDYLSRIGMTHHSGYTEWPLKLCEGQNGWFIFGFDMEQLSEATMEKIERYNPNAFQEQQIIDAYVEPYNSLFQWIDQNQSSLGNSEHCPSAHLELTTYDEAGTPLRTESWPLVREPRW